MKTELTAEERGCCLKAVAIAVVALVILLLAGGWLWSRHAAAVRASLEEAEAQWAASGAPVTIDDLIARAAPGDPETYEWLRWFGEVEVAWRDMEVWTVADARDMLELARESQADPVDLARIEAWMECLGDESFESQLVDPNRWELLESHTDLKAVSECERLALWMWFECSGPRYERALEVLERGPIDWATRLKEHAAGRDLSMDDPFPNPPIEGYFELLTILGNSANLAAREGRTAEAMHLLDRAMYAAGLLGDPQSLFGYVASYGGVSGVVDDLERILPWLPADADLTGVHDFLATQYPKRELTLAIEAERVHGNRFINLIGTGDREDVGASGSRPSDALTRWSSTFFEADRTAYLRAMASLLDACSSGGAGSEAADVSIEAARSESRLAGNLLPRIAELRADLAAREVRLQFALAALQAHTQGIDAAIATITAIEDPFSGSPLQARLEEDGTLLMWSVGHDEVDQGGDGDDYEDLVWRYWVAR